MNECKIVKSFSLNYLLPDKRNPGIVDRVYVIQTIVD